MNELKILHGRCMNSCNAKVAKYFEGYYSFQMIGKGEMVLGIDGSKTIVKKGQGFFCYPGPFITMEQTSGPWQHWYIAFKGSIAEKWFKEKLIFKNIFSISDMEVIKRYLLSLYQIGFTSSAIELKKTKCLLELLLLELQTSTTNKLQTPEWLQMTCEYLKSHPFEKVEYDVLARQFHQSYSHFRKYFKKYMGISLHQYHILIRMEEAKILLQQPEYNLDKIAEKICCADVFSFNKLFKQIVGISPGSYRKSLFTGEYTR